METVEIKKTIAQVGVLLFTGIVIIQFILWVGTIAIVVKAHEVAGHCKECEECPIELEERRPEGAVPNGSV